MMDDASPAIISALTDFFAKSTGQIMHSNRHWRMQAVLKPVLVKHKINDLSELPAILAAGGNAVLEVDCVEAMLNNETSFFRDQPNFALLTGPVLDQLRQVNMQKKRIRIWSMACSTGQEAYSLAMAFSENATKWEGWRIEIIASDISASAIQKARSGRYSQFEIQRGLPVMMMLRYFDQVDTDWQLKDTIRHMVSFRQENALTHARDFGEFDIVLCRNLLMYLSEENRRKVLDNIADHSHDDTLLMLGAAETVIGQTDRFESNREFRGFYSKPAKTGTNAFEKRRFAAG